MNVSSISAADRARLAGHVVVASVSGGKDSGAMSLWLAENGIEHRRVFFDTGWEHPWTYAYLRGPLTEKIGPIEEVHAEHEGKRETLITLVRRKGIFPDRTKRFCTEALKVEPAAAYLARIVENEGADVINAIGVRREESAKRATALDWEYSKAVDCDLWRPLAAWNRADVLAIHRRHGLALNPLYAMGASRVGCWPCIHARKAEIALLARTDPPRVKAIAALERELTRAAEARAAEAGEPLVWQRSLFSLRESQKRLDPETGEMRRHHRPMPIDEAVAWATTENRTERNRRERAQQVELFAEPGGTSCGTYGYCDQGDTP